jgi:recombinational DNA repair ATPase RecF
MKIKKLELENILRVSVAEIEPDGSLVMIGGKNAQGKTSVLRSIEMLIGGARAAAARPVKDGAKNGTIIGTFDNGMKAVRVFGADGATAVKLVNADGAEYRKPQTLLDSFFSALTFDPLAFARMDASEQAEQFRRLAGLDFAEEDAERERIYQERRDVNRDLKAALARLEAALVHKDAQVEPVSVEALANELDEANAENNRRREATTEAQNVYDEAVALVENHREAITTAVDELDKAEEALKRAQEEVAGCQRALAFHRKQHQDNGAALAEMTRPGLAVLVDTAPIKARIAQAEDINRRVRENEQRETIALEVEGLQGSSDGLTARLLLLDEAKATAIRDAKLPIDGLGLNGDGVTFGGMPFDQCSDAERVRVSTAMAIAMNPELKVLLIRDGSLLDTDNRAMIRTMAEEAGSQVWMEVVGEDAECSVIMVDGTVRADVEEAKP